mmetsp:Transcript_2349/g.3371  ORF Transcript_2349/g.3371 Transcript_2349/m.3371 type:complete len:82 (+) Transcript_2349:92-337(+)
MFFPESCFYGCCCHEQNWSKTMMNIAMIYKNTHFQFILKYPSKIQPKYGIQMFFFSMYEFSVEELIFLRRRHRFIVLGRSS